MSLTTGNVIKHLVQYLNHEVDYMFIVMNHCYKTPPANCHIKVTESIKIAKVLFYCLFRII